MTRPMLTCSREPRKPDAPGASGDFSALELVAGKVFSRLWLKVPQIIVTDSCSFQIGEQRFRLTVGG